MDGCSITAVVTAGPTREYLDPVRFLSNSSSGSMGYLIASCLRDAGLQVILISGPTTLTVPDGVTAVQVTSAAEMDRAVRSAVRSARALVMAAAVSDWKPARRARNKIKRKDPWSLELVPTPDILHRVSRMPGRRPFIVGFALETVNMCPNARAKLAAKGADMIVANTPSYMGGDRQSCSPVAIVHRDGSTEDLGVVTKEVVARYVAGAVARRVMPPAM